METQTIYNTRSPAVKRLMREAVELKEPADEYYVQPLEDNLFEWHFTINGPPSTEFEGGIYHGRIVLPTEYPMKPPNIIILTPNGRFETNKNICLSISGHHPETWQPSWSIRTALLALIAFMPTPGNGMIGALDYTVEERKLLARRSRKWKCPICGDVSNLLNRRNHSDKCEDRITTAQPKKDEDNAESTSTETVGNGDPCINRYQEKSEEVNGPQRVSNLAREDNVSNPVFTSEVDNPERQNSYFLQSSIVLAVIVLLIALLIFRRFFLL